MSIQHIASRFGDRTFLSNSPAQTVGLRCSYGACRHACRVERSLYERANGYSYDAVKIFMPAGAKEPVIVHYTEHCPPDVGAAFIWLKNRDPERWRDVQNVEHVLGKYIIWITR